MFPILVHSIHPKGFLIFPPTSPTYVKSGSTDGRSFFSMYVGSLNLSYPFLWEPFWAFAE